MEYPVLVHAYHRQVEKNQAHRLDTQLDNLANRIFDELEASTRGCQAR
jgi:hypothetical protein